MAKPPRERRKKPGELLTARARHLTQAANAAALAKLRLGQEAELVVDGQRYRVRPPGGEYYPALLAVAQLRPGHWVVGWVVDKDGLRICETLGAGNSPGAWRKRIQFRDVLADVVKPE